MAAILSRPQCVNTWTTYFHKTHRIHRHSHLPHCTWRPWARNCQTDTAMLKTSSKHHHYCDVIMSAMANQKPASRLFTQTFIQTQIKENIKAPRHWPLCGNSPGTGEFSAQMASYAENVSIWWRHHESPNESQRLAGDMIGYQDGSPSNGLPDDIPWL